MSDAELIEDAARSAGEIEQLADLIVEKLNQSVIPSAIPAEIGEWIRETCGHSQFYYRHMIPMSGPTCIHAEWKLNPDGTINLQLQDTNARPFWFGTFRPADE
jgi:hypothetical protein